MARKRWSGSRPRRIVAAMVEHRVERRYGGRRLRTGLRRTGQLRRGQLRTGLLRVGLLRVGLLCAASLGGVGPATPAAAADGGSWTWPLAGEPAVVRGFDPPQVRYAAGHRGADLAGTPGEPVLAAGAGRVSYAGLLAGRGVVVVVHGDLRTTYEPVTAEVALGDEVTAGQQIGRLDGGHQGCPVAACLHWGLKRGEAYLDPVRLIDRGPVRLLPLAGRARAVAGGQIPVAAAPVPALSPPADPPRVPAAPAPEPGWSLRAAEAPLGTAAVIALIAGLAVIATPRRPPHGPSAPATAAGAAPAVPASQGPQPPALGPPVDLASERLRRRTAS